MELKRKEYGQSEKTFTENWYVLFTFFVTITPSTAQSLGDWFTCVDCVMLLNRMLFTYGENILEKSREGRKMTKMRAGRWELKRSGLNNLIKQKENFNR